jgi:hypothetical protein
MPFDPNWPQNGQLVDADRFRDQFSSLKALIDAIQGGITNVVVDAVNTTPPGSPANVGVSLNGTELHFTFDLPQGNDGPQGPQGGDGGQGPPFAQAVVDGVNTLPPGSPAAVHVSFDGTNVHFNFDIPQGNDGPTGATGQPGEVTQTDLNNGLLSNLTQCSNNSNGVSTLDSAFGDPEAEELRNKLNELINALRR